MAEVKKDVSAHAMAGFDAVVSAIAIFLMFWAAAANRHWHETRVRLRKRA